MKFEKKLKIRLYTAVTYLIFGLCLIACALIFKTENYFVSSFGFALFIIGAARVRNYFIITRSEENIRRQKTAESDERNIEISRRAKSLTFLVYIILSGIAVIVLSFMGKNDVAAFISYPVCAMIVIYWISWFIYNKKI